MKRRIAPAELFARLAPWQLTYLKKITTQGRKGQRIDLLITDEFGSWWEKCERHDCDLHVVRPGKVQCDGCNEEVPE